MKGADLLNLLIDATGLSPTYIQEEVKRLLSSHGLSIEDLNLNVLREIMADYLQDNLPNIKNQIS